MSYLLPIQGAQRLKSSQSAQQQVVQHVRPTPSWCPSHQQQQLHQQQWQQSQLQLWHEQQHAEQVCWQQQGLHLHQEHEHVHQHNLQDLHPAWMAHTHSRLRCRQPRVEVVAAAAVQQQQQQPQVQQAGLPLDLLHWPEGKRPKSGSITQAGLMRLKVDELRSELTRLGVEPSQQLGTKPHLVAMLLATLNQQPLAAAAPSAQHRQEPAVQQQQQEQPQVQQQPAPPAAVAAGEANGNGEPLPQSPAATTQAATAPAGAMHAAAAVAAADKPAACPPVEGDVEAAASELLLQLLPWPGGKQPNQAVTTELLIRTFRAPQLYAAMQAVADVRGPLPADELQAASRHKVAMADTIMQLASSAAAAGHAAAPAAAAAAGGHSSTPADQHVAGTAPLQPLQQPLPRLLVQQPAQAQLLPLPVMPGRPHNFSNGNGRHHQATDGSVTSSSPSHSSSSSSSGSAFVELSPSAPAAPAADDGAQPAATTEATGGTRASAATGTEQQQQQQQQQQPLFLQPQNDVVVRGCMPPYDHAEAEAVAAAVGVVLDELPPLTQQCRGHVFDVSWMTGLSQEERDLIVRSNRAGLTLTLLGGAVCGSAAGDSSPPALGLIRQRDIWLFDAGEDTQRGVMWLDHIKPSKTHRIVISRQAPDALLGLPGLLCIVGASREKGHETADIPVHVFGPEGTTEFVSTMFECGNTYLEMAVIIHEFVHHAVSEEDMTPQPYNTRSKLWRVLMPPDQLNPSGCIDAALESFMPMQGRARVVKGARAAGGVLAKDPRAGYRSLPLPPPGDPTLANLPRSAMTWTVVADEGAMFTAVALEAPDLTWGIVWREADKQGNLSVARCDALGITDAAHYKPLKAGQPALNKDGIAIPASMVCTQDKPGRKVVLLPPCTDPAGLGHWATNADVMFANAAAGVAQQQQHHSAAAAPAAAAAAEGEDEVGASVARCAQEWGVRTLVLTGMPHGSTDASNALTHHPLMFRRTRNAARGSSGRKTGSISPTSSQSDGESDDGGSDDAEEGRESVSSSAAAAAAAATDAGHTQQHEQQTADTPVAAAVPLQQQEVADPVIADLLQRVRAHYTAGVVLPGCDFMDICVEEHSGTTEPPPLDMAAKEEEARAVSLVMCADALTSSSSSNKGTSGGSSSSRSGGASGRSGRGGGRSGGYRGGSGGGRQQGQQQHRGGGGRSGGGGRGQGGGYGRQPQQGDQQRWHGQQGQHRQGQGWQQQGQQQQQRGQSSWQDTH